MTETTTGIFYLTQFSTGSLIVSIFSLTFALFYLIGKNRSKATIHLGIAFALLSAFHLSYFIAFSFYSPYMAFHRWFTVSLVLFTEIHIVLFVIQYPDNRNQNGSTYIQIFMYCIALAVSFYYIVNTISSPEVFRFDGHFWDLDNKRVSFAAGASIMLFGVMSILVVVWRVVQLKKRELVWMLMVTIPFLIGMLIPSILNILYRQGEVSREVFQITLNISHLFGFFVMSLVHLNTTKDRFTFMGKIVGVTIVTLLGIFLIFSRLYIHNIDNEYDKMRIHELQLGFAGITHIPEYRYLVAYEPERKTVINVYTASDEQLLPPFNPAEYENLRLTEILKKTPADNFTPVLFNYLAVNPELFSEFKKEIYKLNSLYAVDPVLFRVKVLSKVSTMLQTGPRFYKENIKQERFISYIIRDHKSEKIYEGGFSYLNYREYMHSHAERLVKLIIFVLLFMVIGYPWLYYGTLYFPLKALMNGVEAVKSGNLNFRLEIKSEDEIGLLTDRFNLMIDRLTSDRETILQSEKKYRELTDLLPDIIYEADLNLKITYLNRSGFLLTGYDQTDLDNNLSLRQMLNDKDVKLLEEYISSEHSSQSNIFSRTHYVMRKSGNKFLGDNSSVIIYSNNSISTGIRGIIRDITEKKMTEDALMQIQKMDTVGTLAGGIAHDFNNILGGITGPLSLIKFSINKNEELDLDEIKMLLSTMENSSSRAIDMVKQLLSLSNKSPSVYIPVDLVSSIQNVLKICSSTFDKSIELIFNCPERSILTEGDPTQLEQSILNICINASHAMTIMKKDNSPPGGRLSISLNMVQGDSAFRIAHPSGSEDFYWNITITDTGVGMDPDTVSRIFMPFFTTKEKNRGTGLGLSMVYSIIRNHKGFIDVYSSPGKGTAFYIFLPVLKSAALQKHNDDKNIPRGNGTILVVDDEEMIRRTARLILEKCGYSVITAADGNEAIDIITGKCELIDLIIIDLIMPGISGDRILDEILALCSDKIKILLASGLTEDERIHRAVETTGCGFIQKPYTMEKLSRTVYEILKKVE